jgi:acetyl-CoA C-acetyltransferase
MTDAYVLAAVRTPRGKGSPRRALAAVPPLELVSGLMAALVRRGLDPARVDDVVLGCATQAGPQGGNLARTAALRAGWAAPGAMVNRFCASGLDAIATARARIVAGDAAMIVASGVESVSQAPMFSDGGPLWTDPALGDAVGALHMGVAADLIATIEGFTRGQLDDYAARTRAKAQRAWATGAAARSVVPVVRGSTVVLARDELIAWSPGRAELGALAPAFAELGAQQAARIAHHRPQLPPVQPLHTRGSSPALADGAALLVIGDRAAAARAGVAPRARLVATATCAGDPVTMLLAGQAATERVLARAGLRAADIDVFVVAEAFAATCLRFQRDLDLDEDRWNPGGGTMTLGHAFGATGAILVADAVDALEASGGRRAIAAVSGAAGVGVAILLERDTFAR